MATLGIGLIGCGLWGRRLAGIVRQLDGAEVVAAFDTDARTMREFATPRTIVARETCQALLEDPRVDAVLVVVPHSLHEEVVVGAARAGKHAFCEKPLAIDVAQCRRMIAAVERHGVKLMCGHVTRLYPIWARAAHMVHGGRVGRLSAVSIANMKHIDRTRWWARSETMGALLHSPAVHFIDYLLFVCGSPAAVHAVETRVRVQPGVDYQDSVFLHVEFENGAIGAIQASVSCLTPATHCQVIGDRGSLRFDPDESVIEFASWDGERERIEIGPDDPAAREDIGIRAELESFVAWVQHGTEPVLTASGGLRAVEIIEAAYRSIEERGRIALPLADRS